MIIKIIAENDAEKKRMIEKFGAEKIVHKGVQEYLVFGNKVENNYLVDFQEWIGSYKYLLANLNYFYEIVNDERKMAQAQQMMQAQAQVQAQARATLERQNTPVIKHGAVNKPNIQQIDTRNLQNRPKIVEISREEMQRVVGNDGHNCAAGDNENPNDNRDMDNEDMEAEDIQPIPMPQRIPTIPSIPTTPNIPNFPKESRGLRIIPNNQNGGE